VPGIVPRRVDVVVVRSEAWLNVVNPMIDRVVGRLAARVAGGVVRTVFPAVPSHAERDVLDAALRTRPLHIDPRTRAMRATRHGGHRRDAGRDEPQSQGVLT